MVRYKRRSGPGVLRGADAPPTTRGRMPRSDEVVFELLHYPHEYGRILVDEADRRGLRFPRGTVPNLRDVVRFIKGTLKKTLIRQGIK